MSEPLGDARRTGGDGQHAIEDFPADFVERGPAFEDSAGIYVHVLGWVAFRHAAQQRVGMFTSASPRLMLFA